MNFLIPIEIYGFFCQLFTWDVYMCVVCASACTGIYMYRHIWLEQQCDMDRIDECMKQSSSAAVMYDFVKCFLASSEDVYFIKWEVSMVRFIFYCCGIWPVYFS